MKQVTIDGAIRDVRCRVRSLDGFSAHADEPQLLDWIATFATGKRAGDRGFPKTVFVVHGDPEAEHALRVGPPMAAEPVLVRSPERLAADAAEELRERGN